MKNSEFERELPRSHDAPWLARRSLGGWYGAMTQADELHRAKLLTSELVTNAVLHGRGQITLSARLQRGRLVVEVADEGPGFQYAVGQRSLDHLRGRGLAIVDAESAAWGIGEGMTQVWFELAVSIPAQTCRY
ncbi:MAG TPA: ATP-binding protein [Solirubrobacteraceae bacterium]|jgi:anti-sigma regulatory factor (Ser/Thr protein kinase)|nr:ATP-binding protein [Solirubrobacteraceae bacterium]